MMATEPTLPSNELLQAAQRAIRRFISELNTPPPPPPMAAEPRASPDLSKAKLRDFELLRTLGTGTFGKVKLCRYLITGEYMCMKILSKEKVIRLKQQEHVKNEKLILTTAKHPFLVKLYVAASSHIAIAIAIAIALLFTTSRTGTLRCKTSTTCTL